LIAVVPLVGTGKAGDPIRPKYAPVPVFIDTKRSDATATLPPPPRPDWEKLKPEERTEIFRQQIQGFSYVLTDDKKHAIVEFVAGDRRAFAELLKDKNVRVFEPKDYQASSKKRDDLETELKKSKKDFDLRQLRTKGF
jgi:hypothetical protein